MIVIKQQSNTVGSVKLKPQNQLSVTAAPSNTTISSTMKITNRGSLSLKVVSVDGSIKPSTQADAVSVTSTYGVVNAQNRLDALADVVEGATPSENSTLVYDEDTDTYVVKQMDLDGGSF